MNLITKTESLSKALYVIKAKEENWEITVANAAPFTPKPNPQSKIKIGSNNKFNPVPTTIAIIAVFALPSALTKLFKIIETVWNTTPNRITDKYCLAKPKLSSVAPKKLSSSSTNSNPNIAIATEVNTPNLNAVFTVLSIASLSLRP